MEWARDDGDSVDTATAAFVVATLLRKVERYVDENRAMVKTLNNTNKLLQSLGKIVAKKPGGF